MSNQENACSGAAQCCFPWLRHRLQCHSGHPNAMHSVIQAGTLQRTVPWLAAATKAKMPLQHDISVHKANHAGPFHHLPPARGDLHHDSQSVVPMTSAALASRTPVRWSGIKDPSCKG